MKTHLTAIIGRLKRLFLTFFINTLETLMPARAYKRSSYTSHLEKLNHERIFGSEPFPYSINDAQAFFSYRNKEIKKCIWNFKYYLRPLVTEQLSSIMTDELIAHLSGTLGNTPFNSPTLLVYCPSSSFASGKKEFDHMEKLVLNIEAQMNHLEPFMQICINAVCINKNMEAQHHGNKKERLSWANNRFSLSKYFREHIKNSQPAHIICIDDIITTGATFGAIKNIFSEAETIEMEFFALCFTPLNK